MSGGIQASGCSIGIVSHDGWSPEASKCHENVDYWVKLNPHLKAVRGWMIVTEDESGRCIYEAHSVVEADGKLYDITLPNQAACVGIRFVRHRGTKDEFFEVLDNNRRSSVTYPPFTNDESLASQEGADQEEPEDEFL